MSDIIMHPDGVRCKWCEDRRMLSYHTGGFWPSDVPMGCCAACLSARRQLEQAKPDKDQWRQWLLALDANRDDAFMRMVYADWLDEQGLGLEAARIRRKWEKKLEGVTG